MYPNDQDFNFYHNNNQNTGFGDYTDTPPQQPYQGYQPYQNDQTPPQPAPKKKAGMKAVALVLACAIAGGAAGVGGAAAYNTITGKNTTVVYQSERIPAQTLANTNNGQPMTPQQLYAANLASCVGITVSTTTNIWGYTSTSAASGSGFVLTQDGYIVTNYHVIEDAAKDSTVPITVSFQNGDSYSATLVGGEQGNDVAVLKIEATGLQPVTLGDSDLLVVGEEVFAIGNPLGELTYTLTDGLVSALDRLITTTDSTGTTETTLNVFQTNCAINPGNSGGPLFNEYGEVIGIATAKYSSSKSGTIVEGLGFGMPINDVKNIISDLIQYGYVTGKPYMGIQMQSVPESAQMYGVSAGAYITSVAEGSSAQKAGLQQGDIIVAVDETVIDSSSALSAAVSAYRAGDTAKLTVIRSNEKLELTITFDEKNAETEAANQQPQEQTQTQQQVPSQQNPQYGFGNGNSGYYYNWPFGNFFW